MRRRHSFSRWLTAVVVAALATGGLIGTGVTEAGAVDITSPGPLTSVGVSPTLNCSANYLGDAFGEFFGNTYCGTFVTVDGTVYGPFSVGGVSNAVWTPVSQTGPTGSGSAEDPFTVVTVANAGDTGIQVTQTDTYIVGLESFRTDVRVQNASGVPKDVRVNRAADCYLQDSDAGYGAVDAATGAVACTTGLEAGARIEQWFPITAGSHYYEDHYSSVWARIGSQLPFPDSCTCSTFQDNGAGLSWDATIAASANRTFSSFITFSPLGIQPLSLGIAADAASVGAGGTAGYTITVDNPNSSAVTLTSLSDALPADFGYIAGSTTGLTTANPTVSEGNELTWDGPLLVPASGQATLHFTATVGTTAGTFTSSVTATTDGGYTIAPTGPDAPVTVTSGPAALALTLAPTSSTVTLGGPAPALVAHAARGGAAQAGVDVTFSVVAGPDAGVTQTVTTNAAGDATFVPPAAASAGTDVVSASAPDGAATVTSNQASVTWVAGAGALGATGSVEPATVTAGSRVHGRFTITNSGGPLTGAYALVTLPAGAVGVSATSTPGGCSSYFGGTVAVCLFGDFPAGGTATIDAVAGTGTLAPGADLTIAVEAHADGQAPAPASSTALVTADEPGEVTGFVPPGGTIATDTTATPDNPTIASLTLPPVGPGATITLRAETEGVETFCNGLACRGKIMFVSPFEGYDDPTQPVVLTITWDKSVVGKQHRLPRHSRLWVQKQPNGRVVLVRRCVDPSVAVPSPCISRIRTVDGGDRQYDVLLTSGDPRFARR